MLNAKVSANYTIAERLQRLAALYQHGQTSPIMERTLHKLLTHEADVCRTHLKELRRDLAVFEQQYDLDSDEFYRRFQAGQTDDRMDYVEWASLVQMAENLQARLRLLTKE